MSKNTTDYRTISILVKDGTQEVEAGIYHSIAVHGDYVKGFSVTHIPTGRRICWLRSATDAHNTARRLTRSAEGRAICAKVNLDADDLAWISERRYGAPVTCRR